MIGWILRAGLAGLFVVAAVHKLRDATAFVATLRDYRILPPALVPAAAAGVVCVEVGIALALLAPGLGSVGALEAAGLLLGYTAAIATNLARGRRDIDCGCLGPAQRQPLSGWLVARNLALVCAALAAAVPLSMRALGALDVLTFVGGLGTAVLLFIAANQLAAQAPALHRLGRSS